MHFDVNRTSMANCPMMHYYREMMSQASRSNTYAPEISRQARNRAFLLYLCLILALWVVNTVSVTANLQNQDASFSWYEPTVLEGSSLTLMVPLFFLAWLIVEKWTFGRVILPQVVASHFLGSIVFSFVHVTAMIGVRKLIWPVMFDRNYMMQLNSWMDLVQEYGKDSITYSVAIALLYLFRYLGEAQQELDLVRSNASHSKRLTLKSNGKTVFVDTHKFEYAAADGNYIHLVTSEARYHVRMSLSQLELLLRKSNLNVFRSHKSWLVNADEVKSVEHKRNGDMVLELPGGQSVPASRRYKDLILEKCGGF